MSSAKTRAGQSVKATKRHEGYQYSGAQVQNSKKSRVYIFGDADIQDDDVVEYELSEVRSRKSTKPFQQADDEPTYLEREITEGDSLRSISLQYGCSVAEIKRVNNMIQDQEFYAFKKIKVPIQKYSFLTETMNKASEATQEKNGASSCNGMTIVDETIDTDQESLYHDTDTESICNLSDPETQRLLIKKSLSIKDNTNSQTREAKRFLRNMDKDLSKICKTARPNHSSLNEVVSMLTNRSIQPIPSKKVNQFNGADCGIRWWSIALCTLLAVILIPLIILLYYFRTGKLAADGAHG